MKTFIKLLINSLEYLLEVVIDRMGIVKYIITTNALMYGSKGTLERVVMYSRHGRQEIRTKPHQFIIKNPAYWQGRFDRFRAAIKLGKSINFSLAELYENEPAKGTLFNLIISQVLKFWVGGPAPYTFAPGTVDAEIGNGTMPDAREVVFIPLAGGKLQIVWDTTCTFPNEHADDVLQIMLIIKTGEFGEWRPMIDASPGPYVKRSDGSCTWQVPNKFLDPSVSLESFCAVKFKAGAELDGQVKGKFKFPVGIMPITLIP